MATFNIKSIKFKSKNLIKWAGNVERSLFSGIQAYSKDEAEDIIMLMKAKTRPHQFSSGMGISVTDSFITRPFPSVKGNISYSIENIAPHAAALEFGVEPHVVPVRRAEFYGTIDHAEKLKRWAEARLGFIPKFIYPGGMNSSIKKGNSQRKFFFNTLDEYANSDKRSSNLKEEITKAFRKSK